MPVLLRSDPRPCAVYRWFAETGRLLYVGCSTDPEARWKTLRWSEPSWTALAIRRTETWYPNVAEALDAELAAIQSEQPLMNLSGLLRGSAHFIDHWRELLLKDGSTLRMLRMPHQMTWLVGERAISEGLRAREQAHQREHRVGKKCKPEWCPAARRGPVCGG